jgi:glycosyltransferase involved in cell wall biosynthesis
MAAQALLVPARRPKVLFVTPVVPAFAGLGAAMRCAQSLDALCNLADVTLLILRRPAIREEVIDSWFHECTEQVVDWYMPERSMRSGARFGQSSGLIGRLRRVLRGAPLELDDYPPELAHGLTLNNGEPFHSMHVFRLRAAPIALRLAERLGIPKARRVLDLDDLESKAMRRLADARRHLLGHQTYWLDRLESAKTARAEERLGSGFGSVLLCSAKDRDEFQQRCPSTTVTVLPNVYPLPTGDALPAHSPPARPTVLFVGSLDYLPNQDAVRLLLDEIVPRVRRDVPNVIFRVAGRRPPEWMTKDCQAAWVDLVPNPPDMAPLYRDATVTVVPLLSGGGTRIKILEAFAYGVPVISTTVGAEGLEITPGQDILIADVSEDFARDVVALLANEERRTRISVAGRTTLERFYSAPRTKAYLCHTHALGQGDVPRPP